MWRYAWRNRGSKNNPNWKAELAYGPCDTCDSDMKPILGCGWLDATRGCGTCPYTHGVPKLKTCPEWYYHQPAVTSVWELLPSYRKGMLGPIWDLPSFLTEYLETLDAEMESFIHMDKS